MSARLTGGRRVQNAVRRVVADIEAQGHQPRPIKIVEPAADRTWAGSASEDDVLVDYGGHTFLVAADLDLATLTVEVAQRIQDDVIVDAGRGWPRGGSCRAPLEARLSELGEAMWWDGDDPIVSIGSVELR